MSHTDPEAAREEMKELFSEARRVGEGGDDPFVIDGRRFAPAEVLSLLDDQLTERRKQRIREVVSRRTKRLIPVVEGLANVGNVSAVVRSAEALGCRELHVVEGMEQRFKQSERTSQGAEKWLDLMRWRRPGACADHLQHRGYRVVATCLSEEAVPIGDIDFSEPVALVVGNERDGISEAMRQAADRTCIIPLPGFTESLNVSVAAAVALYHARRQIGLGGDLSEEEQQRLRARFYLQSVNHARRILRRKTD